MWPFKKTVPSIDLSPTVAAAIIISVIALCVSAGVMRWSWLILDEQIQLRNEFMELQNDQKQTQQQYEYWLDKLHEERNAWEEMNEKK